MRTVYDGRDRHETPLWLPDHRTLLFADDVRGTPNGLRIWDVPWYEQRTLPAMRQLLRLPFETVLTAHGEPVLDRAAFEHALTQPPSSKAEQAAPAGCEPDNETCESHSHEALLSWLLVCRRRSGPVGVPFPTPTASERRSGPAAPCSCERHSRPFVGSTLDGGRTMSGMDDDSGSWEWPEELDGASAAPDSHRVLSDQGGVRVLEVIVRPGHREPEHTHRRPSVMIVDGPARLRYYAGSRPAVDVEYRPSALTPAAEMMAPEGPHSVENIDDHDYHAFRIEYPSTGPL